MRFKAHFQESYLDQEELEKTLGAAGNGNSNNVKHGKMEDAFINISLVMAAREVELTKMTTKNGNLKMHLRQNEDNIWALQMEMCNLTVVAAVLTNQVKVTNKGGGQPYTHEKNTDLSGQPTPLKRNTTIKLLMVPWV